MATIIELLHFPSTTLLQFRTNLKMSKKTSTHSVQKICIISRLSYTSTRGVCHRLSYSYCKLVKMCWPFRSPLSNSTWRPFTIFQEVIAKLWSLFYTIMWSQQNTDFEFENSEAPSTWLCSGHAAWHYCTYLLYIFTIEDSCSSEPDTSLVRRRHDSMPLYFLCILR